MLKIALKKKKEEEEEGTNLIGQYKTRTADWV